MITNAKMSVHATWHARWLSFIWFHSPQHIVAHSTPNVNVLMYRAIKRIPVICSATMQHQTHAGTCPNKYHYRPQVRPKHCLFLSYSHLLLCFPPSFFLAWFLFGIFYHSTPRFFFSSLWSHGRIGSIFQNEDWCGRFWECVC